jgi:murein DD-endopeptidase MepM/ murein hydrolase activator NlpD
MRRPSLALSLIIIFLAGCGQTADSGPQTTDHRPSQTINDQTSIVSSQLPTQSSTPLAPTPTPTPLPCNPLTGYCVEDGHFFLDRPIALPGTITIDRGYPYGSTERGTREPHHGVEFYNASGTPVLAAADGLVVVAGNDSGTIYSLQAKFYGNLIVLEHRFSGIDQAVFTLYGHLSKVDVQTGQTVQSGDKIGEVGSTGFAIGSHLHFEVRLGKNDYDSTRNPVLWLKPLTEQDGNSLGVIAGRLVNAQGNLIHATDVNIQYFPDLNGPQAAAYQVETYAPEQHSVNGDDDWSENFTMGDLPAGNYRISLVWGGKVYDHWLVVMPGKVTFFIFQIDQ